MDDSNAKIYCIRNYNDSDVYVGSTCQPLSKRMADHRMSINSKRDGNMFLYAKISILNCLKNTPAKTKSS